MTHDEEQRLRSLLEEAAPAPPTALSGPQVRAAASRPAPSRRVDRVLALAALAVVVVGIVGVVWWAGRSGSALPDGEPQPSVSPFECAQVQTYRPPPQTTGTAPKTVPASAFGPYAVHDVQYVPWTGSNGRSVVHVYPNGPVPWTVFDFTYSYADAQVAAQAVSDSVAMRRCAGAEILRPPGADDVAGAVFVHQGNTATWTVLVRVGPNVSQLSVSNGGSSLDPPGDGFLVGMAAAARRVMTGTEAGSIPLPSPTPTTAPAPAGFLVPSTVGDGWQIGGQPGDGLFTLKTAHAPGPDCNGVSVALAEAGQSLLYRGRLPGAPEGSDEWLLTEGVVTLTPDGRTTALAQMAAAADGSLCSRTTVLFSGAGIAGDYVFAEGARTGGSATVYVVDGDRLITLLSLPGGAMGSDVPIPGGNQWLIDTARAAVQAARTT